MDSDAQTREIRYCGEAGLIFAIVGLAGIVLLGDHSDWPEIALFCLLICLPAAIVLGLIGLEGKRSTRNLACCGLLIAIVPPLFWMLVPGLPHAREPARRAQTVNNFKQVGLALNNYMESNGRLPPAVVRDPDGRSLYSWRVLILPYMDQYDLYRKFHLNEPWDSPHNKQLLPEMPSPFMPLRAGEKGLTYIQSVVGTGTLFEDPSGEPKLKPDGSSNFTDSASDTILIAESGVPVPWTAPRDVALGAETPALGGSFVPVRPIFRLPPGISGAHFGMLDGSVRFVKFPISSSFLRSLATRNGGERIGAY